MKQTTLCFCITDSQVLLGMKKEGFGVNKWNGFGGKVKPNETPRQAAARELLEESKIAVNEKDLVQMAIVRFYFDIKPIFECHTFTTRMWKGEPKETNEMRPQWFHRDKIPFEDMWAGDAKWLPVMLLGQKIEASVVLSEDGSALKEFTYSKLNLPELT